VEGVSVVRQLLSNARASPSVGRLVAGLVGVLVVLGLLYLVIVPLPERVAVTEGLKPTDAREEVGRVRTAMLAGIACLIAMSGALLTALTYRLNRLVAEQTHERDRESQITERFTRAIDQLGHDKLDVRLGGIYALERIARDSMADHPQVVEVLTAYVREHARLPEEADDPEEVPGGVTTDVQAALTVLARRRTAHEADAPRLDLACTDLRGARLARASFDGADLQGAWLTAADFSGASMRLAVLNSCRLEHATFSSACLAHADLSKALLRETDLADANLTDATMRGTRLNDAFLYKADLSRANLTRAVLDGADFDQAVLTLASLRRVDAGDASFTEADLQGAKLMGADLSRVNLDQADLTGAVFDSHTSWPEGVDPAKRGATTGRRLRRPGVDRGSHAVADRPTMPD
jgi:uncharacterized protein YjbI with pentapeptide repeats